MAESQRLRRIVVTGATGSIGRHVTRHLLESGYDVTALLRNPDRAALLPDSVTTALGDVTQLDSLIDAFEGNDAVVHMAVAKSDELVSYDVNVVGAKNVIAACHYCRIGRIVNMSTQSAKIARKGIYGETKAQADEAFQSSGLDVVTLRGSIVYGPELLGVFGQLVDAVGKLPVVPVVGDGKWRSRPVHVRDLSVAVEAVLETPAAAGQTYDLGGPDEVTFDQLIDAVSEHLGRTRPRVHVPYRLVLPMVRLMARVLSSPPVTVSNVLGSNQNVDFDALPLARDVAFVPTSLQEGLREVLADV